MKSRSFLDDKYPKKKKRDSYEVVDRIANYKNYLRSHSFVIAIGDNILRKNLYLMLAGDKAIIDSIVHPKAIVSHNLTMGFGTVIMPGAIVNTNSVIQDKLYYKYWVDY